MAQQHTPYTLTVVVLWSGLDTIRMLQLATT